MVDKLSLSFFVDLKTYNNDWLIIDIFDLSTTLTLVDVDVIPITKFNKVKLKEQQSFFMEPGFSMMKVPIRILKLIEKYNKNEEKSAQT